MFKFEPVCFHCNKQYIKAEKINPKLTLYRMRKHTGLNFKDLKVTFVKSVLLLKIFGMNSRFSEKKTKKKKKRKHRVRFVALHLR